MKRARYSPAAREDFFDLWFYISADDERAADAFIDRLYSVCSLIADSPGIGRHRPEIGPMTHSFAVGNYVIFYEPGSGGVDILRVLHGARDVPPLFSAR